MHILVTNDDGVTAPGLIALASEFQQLGKVSVLALDRNWSGGGHVKTIDRPLRIREVLLEGSIPAYASDGAPSDCVALALLGYFPEKVDLVVSGINPMPNLGHDVTYSGTVTAAMESVIWGTPAMAVSLDNPENHLSLVDYKPAAVVALNIAKAAVSNRLPAGVLLNINVPNVPLNQIKGYKITRQGMRVYRDRLEQRIDPRGKPYYWIAGESPTGIPEEGTDIGVLVEKYVSITPLQLDLTAYPAVHLLKEWNIE